MNIRSGRDEPGHRHAVAVMIFFIFVIGSADAADVTRFLVPLNLGTTPGLFQTSWGRQMVIANSGDQDVTFVGLADPSCPIPEGCLIEPIIVAHSTALVDNFRACSEPGGRVLQAPSTSANVLSFTLRTRDLAHESATWGSTVPVVREDRFFGSTFSLADIPLDSRFRTTIRIYDVDPGTPPSVRVRAYLLAPFLGRADTLIEELPQPVFKTSMASGCAAVAEIFLWMDTSLPSSGRIRIEIQPLDGRREYWAFASVTHNDSQHVTVITP